MDADCLEDPGVDIVRPEVGQQAARDGSAVAVGTQTELTAIASAASLTRLAGIA